MYVVKWRSLILSQHRWHWQARIARWWAQKDFPTDRLWIGVGFDD